MLRYELSRIAKCRVAFVSQTRALLFEPQQFPVPPRNWHGSWLPIPRSLHRETSRESLMARLASVASGPNQPRLPLSYTSAQRPALPDCAFLHLLANSPAATQGFLACHQALAGGQLTPRERELLALAVAEINGSKYCLAAHNALAKQVGLTAEEIRSARKATAGDPQEAAMLRFAQAVTLQRGDVSEVDFQALKRAQFSDARIAEIVANIALNIFTNYFNVLARTELDFPALKIE
jgi:uncharacterized peroxidase-related enzyme